MGTSPSNLGTANEATKGSRGAPLPAAVSGHPQRNDHEKPTHKMEGETHKDDSDSDPPAQA